MTLKALSTTFLSQGRYNGKIGSLAVSDCLKCPMGTFNNIERQISEASCAPCQAGSYNPNDGASVCIPCISGITTTQQGAASYDECGKGSGKGSLDSKLNSTVRGTCLPCHQLELFFFINLCCSAPDGPNHLTFLLNREN